jgi:hypothetical protein
MGDQPVADAQGCIPLPKDSIRAVDAQTRTMLLNPPVATSTGAVLESAFEPADGETISVVASINEDGAKHVDMSAEVAARRTTSSRKPPGMRGNRACCSWSRRATMAPRVNYPAGSDEEGDFPRPQAPIPIMKTRSYPQKIGCNGRNEFVRRQDAKLQETVRFFKVSQRCCRESSSCAEGTRKRLRLAASKRSTGQEARFSHLSWQLIAVCRAIAAYFLRV